MRVVIAEASQVDDSMTAEFASRTGYRLVVETGAVQTHGARSGSIAPTPGATREEIVEIPVARIRLTRYQQTLQLDPNKQRKAIEQSQQLGRVNNPIRAWRSATDYILLDGLYRLHAAQHLGRERILAVVEESG